MIVRVLGESDRNTYTALLLRGVKESPECFRITDSDVRKNPSPLAVSEGAEEFTLGIFEREPALGGVVSLAREKGAKMRHKALIFRMYVAPEYVGRGAGGTLMSEVIRLGRRLSGVEQLQLTVLANNARAKRLYARLGFVSFALEKDAVKWEGASYDEERMVLRV